MNLESLDFGIFCFVSLFTMINPIGVVPVYVSMTSSLSAQEAKKVAFKSILFSLFFLSAFAFAGQFIFDFFGISIHSLRIVGGIIFFMVGYEMLQAKIVRTKFDEKDAGNYIDDIAITPLGIPMISGPGAITTVIILMNESSSTFEKVSIFVSIFLIMLISLIVLVSGKKIVSIMGENGKKVMMRVMGLIVMVIAVEFFFTGLKPIIQDILKI